MKRLFTVLLLLMILFCSCEAKERIEDPTGLRPLILFEGRYYANPHIPQKELPAGYESAGFLSEKQANGTGLSGTEYFTNPDSDDFYTFQETGTPISADTVDTTVTGMFYVQWVPVE